MGSIHTVGPNCALVVSGGCCNSTEKRVIVGGWAWTWWLLSSVQKLSLQMMTLKPICDQVETAQGVPVTVTGVAQCKLISDPEFLSIAAEQFVGKSAEYIIYVVKLTLEGHLRAILGTLSVEEVYKDRDKFAALVREVATPDVGKMGIEILSFTIKDVYDSVEYLDSLGKSRTAAVKRDANVGVAQAERDAGIREAECDRSSMDVKYGVNSRVENSNKTYQLKKAEFDSEVNKMKAEAQLAYELSQTKIQQKIRNEEIEVDVVERRKEIAISEKEILRKEYELTSTVKLPAEAEAFRLEMIAKGNKYRTIETSRAFSQRVKMIGAADAYGIEIIGNAEAERMRLKALAYRQYEEAAVLSLTLESLPKMAAEVSAPLAKIKDIVILGDNNQNTIESGLATMAAEIPSAIKAITGMKIFGT